MTEEWKEKEQEYLRAEKDLQEAWEEGQAELTTAWEELEKQEKEFRDAGGAIKAIHVDVSRMAYISSAGLRVLLMMYKSLENKDSFELTGVSEEVREILETTGFDQFLLK